MYIWPGHNWEPDIVSISSINEATRTVTLAAATAYPINTGDRYLIQGSRDLIDRPGEFSLSETEGYLYYWPRSAPIGQQTILAPTTTRIIQVRGRSPTTPARNISFGGLTLTVSDFAKQASAYSPASVNGAVSLANAEGITLHNCIIRNTGGHGVALDGWAQGNVIDGNLIEDLGVHGILLQGPAIGHVNIMKGNRIIGNRIRWGGELHGHGSGVLISNSGGNEVSHNKISDVPRMGIWLSGKRYALMAPSYNGTTVTWDNHWDFINTRANLVQFNDVSHVLQDSEDGGGIYLWSTGKGNTINNNRVHDIATNIPRRDQSGKDDTGLARGIYLDDSSDYNTVTRNVIYGITGRNVSPVVLKGIYNDFSNNVVVNDGEEQPGVQGLFTPSIISAVHLGDRNDHLRISRNVFVSTRASEVYRFFDWTDQRIAEADKNLFFHATGNYIVGFTYDVKNRLTLAQWSQRYGADLSSMVGDPLFVNGANHDYPVKPGSPALVLGFVNIDQSTIGLLPGFPFDAS